MTFWIRKNTKTRSNLIWYFFQLQLKSLQTRSLTSDQHDLGFQNIPFYIIETVFLQISTQLSTPLPLLSPNQISFQAKRAEWNIVESSTHSRNSFSEHRNRMTDGETAWKITTRGKSRLLSLHIKTMNATSAWHASVGPCRIKIFIAFTNFSFTQRFESFSKNCQ